MTPPIPMLETYKVIKQNGISVTLDGHGADELFSGYGHLKHALRCSNSFRQFSEILEIDRSTRTGVFLAKNEDRFFIPYATDFIFPYSLVYFLK